MEFDFDTFFKSPIKAMKLNRSYPYIKRDRKWVFFFIFNYTFFTGVFFIFMYNIIFINIKNKDFYQFCKNSVMAVVYVVVTWQYFILIYYRDDFLNLMASMKNDYENAKTLSLSHQEIIYKYIKQSINICRQWFLIACGGSGFFYVNNIILLLHYWFIGESKLIPVFDLIIPGLIEEKTDNTFIYIAIYGVYVFYLTFASIMYAAFVPLGPIFMLHACGQLEIVQNKIETLFQGNLNQTEARLKDIIEQLQYIYSFVEQIMVPLRLNYEFTLKASAIMLPITCFEALEVLQNGEVPIEFLSFITGGILISSTPCFCSDLLMDKGDNVRNAVYFCGWEKVYNVKHRRIILLISMRALKPVAIKTFFRTLCLEALTDLFHQSYAIFSLMNVMLK